MLKNTSSLIFASVVGLLAATQAIAADLYVAHAINGTDLGSNEALPVDISVNGGCALTNVPYRTISSPVPLDPGQYDIEVRLSDGVCSGALAIVTTINLQLSENATVVAHLTEQGTPTLTKFVNDVRATDPGIARLILRHAAAASPVKAILSQGSSELELSDIRNSQQRAVEVNAGDWDVTIDVFNSVSAGPLKIALESSEKLIIYALGSLKSGTFEPLVQTLP